MMFKYVLLGLLDKGEMRLEHVVVPGEVTIHAYRCLVGKLEGKRPRVRCRHRGEDGFKMDLKEIGRENAD
jgi:hypothetical protein